MKTRSRLTLVPALRLTLAFVLLLCGAAFAQTTYTTIANGNWASASTWLNGSVPPTASDIPSTTIINIRHTVTYNTGNPLKNRGEIRIEPITGTTAQLTLPTGLTVENYPTGKFIINNAALTQFRFVGGGNSGTTQSGNFKNLGGRVEANNAYVEVAQDWTSENGGVRIFQNSCLFTGQNFSISGSTTRDDLRYTNISIGWHGSGSFQSSGQIDMAGLRVQLAGTGGSLQLSGGRAEGSFSFITMKNHVTGNTGSGVIEASSSLNVGTGLFLDAYWTNSSTNTPFAASKWSGTKIREDRTSANFPGPCGAFSTWSIPQIDRQLTKSVNSTSCFLTNQQRTYTLTATNASVFHEGLTVTAIDPIPTGATFVSSTGDGSYNATTGTWTIGSMPPNAVRTRSITLTLTGASNITNTATFGTPALGDPDSSNDTATITLQACRADLTLSKSVNNPAPHVGDTLTYTLELSNAGPEAATSVTITDALPSNLKFLSASSGCSESNRTITCSLATLANGSSASFTINTEVLPQTLGTDLTNAASASAAQADPEPSDNDASVTVTVSGLILGKSVCNASTSDCLDPSDFTTNNSVPPGVTLEYRVTYTRLGPAIFDLTIHDAVPAGTVLERDAYGSGKDLLLVCPDGSITYVAAGASDALMIDLASECSLDEALKGDGVTSAAALLSGQGGEYRYRVTVP
jgi:uncharacterized repeat protein (TIGR01451 family)